MRATMLMQNELMQSSISSRYEQMYKLQAQITSGKKVTTVSDDPLVTYSALKGRSDLRRNADYLNSIDNSMAQIQLADDTLGEISNGFLQIKTLVQQSMSSAATDPSTLESISIQMHSQLESIVALANARVGNVYVFGGGNSSAPPFALDQSSNRIIFSGTTDSPEISLDPGVTQMIGVTGGDIFDMHKVRATVGVRSITDPVNGQINPPANSGKFVIQVGSDPPQTITGFDPTTDGLKDLMDHINEIPGLNARAYIKELHGSYYLQIESRVVGSPGVMTITDGDPAGITTQLGIASDSGVITGTTINSGVSGSLDSIVSVMDALSSGTPSITKLADDASKINYAYDKINENRAIVGTINNRITQSQSIKQNLDQYLTQHLSDIEDVDFAKTVSDLSLQETNYQAALQLVTRIFNLSIVNFI